jgi:hypothetical protein
LILVWERDLEESAGSTREVCGVDEDLKNFIDAFCSQNTDRFPALKRFFRYVKFAS